MISYRVHLAPDDNGTVLVTSPDFPELTSFGDDPIYGSLPDGRLLPIPASRLKGVVESLFELFAAGRVPDGEMLRLNRSEVARLAALDMAAAERAHAKFMAAEETKDVVELGRNYQRMARSLRQTLAHHARVRRETAAPPRAAPDRGCP